MLGPWFKRRHLTKTSYDYFSWLVKENARLIEIAFVLDMVIFAKSVEGLQKMLNTRYQYNSMWSRSLNTAKSKRVIFRNRGITTEMRSGIPVVFYFTM